MNIISYSDSSLGADGIAWKILTGKVEINKGMIVENVAAHAYLALDVHLSPR